MESFRIGVIIVRAYGYENRHEAALLALDEVTLHCELEEVKMLISFLEHVLKEHGSMADFSHLHYRDWGKNWTEESSDFIIAIGSGGV